MMKILNGKNALNDLTDECLDLGDRVLIVFSDNRIKKTGLYARVVSLLNMRGVENVTYECLACKYRLSEVESAIALGKTHSVRLIVAIGDDDLTFFAKMIAHDFNRTSGGGKQFDVKPLPIVNVSSLSRTGISQIKEGFSSDQFTLYASVTPSAVFQNFDF